MSFWSMFARNASAASLATASDAITAGASPKAVGLAAAFSLIGVLMQAMMTHQIASEPAVKAAAAKAVAAIPAVVPQPGPAVPAEAFLP